VEQPVAIFAGKAAYKNLKWYDPSLNPMQCRSFMHESYPFINMLYLLATGDE
jgi:hypothetical protein